MLKRILWIVIVLPIVMMVSFWLVSFIGGILTGDIDLVNVITDHRLLIGLVVTYLIIRYINPFRKRK